MSKVPNAPYVEFRFEFHRVSILVIVKGGSANVDHWVSAQSHQVVSIRGWQRDQRCLYCNIGERI